MVLGVTLDNLMTLLLPYKSRNRADIFWNTLLLRMVLELQHCRSAATQHLAADLSCRFGQKREALLGRFIQSAMPQGSLPPPFLS